MKKPIKKGDKVIWNTGDIWCGPKDKGRWVIRNGDVRVVLDVSVSGDKITLSNDTETGYFGWTDISNVEKITFLIALQLLFNQISCLFGLHKWKYETEDDAEYIRNYIMAFEASSIEAFRMKEPVRECSCCHRKQKLDIHCLGLKPPKFIIDWVNC